MTPNTSRSVSVAAPCKVNLSLDVGPRRADGFHDLDSIVALFDPSDGLQVDVAPGEGKIALTCTDARLPAGDRNLAHRAAAAFLRASAVRADLQIRLEKRVPAEAGLGGGSSDAAAVLLALERLFPDALDRSALHEIAAGIGSDVPLFLARYPAIRMQGRGERTMPLPCVLPTLHGVLVRPAVGVPTGQAYGLLDAVDGRAVGDATSRLLAVLSAGGDLPALAGAMGNDFEPIVIEAFPAVGDAWRAVRDAGALRPLLCGSGSAVFGLARDAAHAEAMAAVLRSRLPWVEVATGFAAEEGPRV